jgi:hypothetical protein
MSQALINAAVRACATLNDLIESLNENECLEGYDGAQEVRSDACEAYGILIEALSVELGTNAHQMIQEMAVAEVEAMRVILTAQTGLRFPIRAKE